MRPMRYPRAVAGAMALAMMSSGMRRTSVQATTPRNPPMRPPYQVNPALPKAAPQKSAWTDA